MEDSDRTQVGPAPGKKDTQGRIGTVLAGRYRIVDLLGEGAQGSVYVGEHLKIGRRDAIKVLQPSLMEDTDAVARFTRGASKASHINHPNVCTVYDFGETEDGLPFMASELVKGEELHDVMQREAPFELERAVALLEQIAAGLNAAHEMNVVHRDLKPANVMITKGRDGGEVVKVVDFDIAKGVGEAESESGLTQAGWIVGTPQYMSPEQITAADVDGRSDVYSLALIFFEMITGRLPNDTSSTQKLMWQRVSGELRGLHEVLPEGAFPPRLQDALDHALAKDREDRIGSAVEFAREVREALEATPEEDEGFAATVKMEAPVPATEISPAPGERIPETRAAPAGAPTPTDAPVRPQEPAATPPIWTRPAVLAGVAGVGIVAVALVWGMGATGGAAAPTLDLSPLPTALAVGESDRLDATLVGEDGSPVLGASVTFGSSDSRIVQVDPVGRSASGRAPGTAYIIVEGGGLRDSVAVTVGSAEQLADAGTGDATPPAESDDPPDRGGAPGTEGPAGERTGDAGDTRETDAGPGTSGGEGARERSWAETAAPAEVHEAVRQMVRTVLLESPGRNHLGAIRDSAQAAWNVSGLPAETRATAAAAYANAADRLGDESAFCTWIGRASQLDPGNRGYQAGLNRCGG